MTVMCADILTAAVTVVIAFTSVGLPEFQVAG